MRCVNYGDTVKVDYVCICDNKIFDTSIKSYAKAAGIYNKDKTYEPFCFKVGETKVIKGFENAVLGMQPNEEKTVAIPPHEAYNHYRKELLRKYPRIIFEHQGIELEPGLLLKINTRSGVLRARVVELDEQDVMLDMNHELAGKTLILKIILREIL